jgi:hypothetical protein
MVVGALGALAGAAPVAYQSAVTASGPILYYKLNETSGDAVNYGSLGATFNASYNGAPARGAPTLAGDTGVRFTGAADFLQSLTTAPAGMTGNPTFSAEAIVLVPNGATASLWPPFLHWGSGNTGHEVYFSLANGNADRVYAGFYNAGLRTSNTVSLGTWHHIAWVRQGGNGSDTGTTLYIDGTAVALQVDPDLIPGILTAGQISVTSTPFHIDRASDATRFFTGTLDEVALYDRALPPAEVLAHAAVAPEPTGVVWAALAGLAAGRWRRRGPA